MFDLLLKGGRIYDGSGMPSFNGDVAVTGGKIAGIGRLNGSAKRILNVDGLAVTPGFIDPHTHLDAQLLWDPMGTSSCFHGVTSSVVGNCGLSLAPCKPEGRDAVIKSFVRVEAISRKVLERAHRRASLRDGRRSGRTRSETGRNRRDATVGARRHGGRRGRFLYQSEPAPHA
jgi:N-acyl-D-aspartate/D-glutamate deacylase